ncbi:hypothetical protein H5410_008611 [Solanum commersonii]|uniref:Uncharacterized protein n=1 Tax=Solanum commersonii TaxID=4109 RepID=A0A9J6AG58_SOLCO|nr:hypothetical protein H5410_008611 [Solanum commersonii]
MTNSVENSGTTPENSSTNLGGNGTITPGIDSNHPYFLTHSDAPGFPEDFQFTHEKGNHSQIRANAAATMEKAEPILNAHTFSQHFNKEQLNFLHKALT